MTNRNVPKLRFPEFNYEWNNYSLEELTKVNQGLQIAIKDRYLEDGTNRYFYITNEFLKENSEKKYYIENPSKSVICTNEDILMTRTGNTGTVVTGVSGAFHNNFFKIKYDKKRLDKNFLYYLLTSNKLQHHILRLAGSSTIPDLNHRDFYSIKISIPNLVEQNKISAFISSIDVKLNLLKDKKNHYVKFKQYLLQNLFPQNGSNAPKLRFKQFIEEWKTYLLKDLGCLYRGHSYNSSNVVESGLLVLRSNNIQNNKLNFDEKELQFVNKACKKEINLKTNDIVICMSNGTKSLVGKTAQYNGEYDGDITVGAFCSIFRSENILSKYIFQIESFKRYLYILLAGTNINNIKNSDLEKFQVVLPSIKEQEEIASFLSSVDKKIDLLNQEIEQVEEYKKGLLQKMFI